MNTLSEREEALLVLLRAALPNHHVVGKLGTEPVAARSRVLRPPEIQVRAARWLPARAGFGQPGGFDLWAIHLVEAELRGPDRRREALYQAVRVVRDTLGGAILAAGHSPLVPAGGRLLQAGDPFAVWEETFEESVPLSTAKPPALFTAIESIGINAQDIAAGAHTVPLPPFPIVPPAVGDVLLVRTLATGRWHSLGVLSSLQGNQATIEFPHPTLLYPGQGQYYRPRDPTRLPVCPAPGSAVRRRANVHVARALDGALHPTRIAPIAHAIELILAPVRIADAVALEGQLLLDHRFAYDDGRGGIWNAAVAQAPRIEHLACATVRLALELELDPAPDLDAMEAEP